LWLRWGDALWLAQRPAAGIWAGLWSLPEFDTLEDFETTTQKWPGSGDALPRFTHVLTHLDWELHPMRWTLPAGLPQARVQDVIDALPAGRWFVRDEALATGLPAPLRKLLESA
jgi:A/G-specific adenine glycosylase